ncbi:hypothetical protein DSM104443_01758 [Usitatibacter rugosus]|uniref:Uncharacterized protein n=1 Tax=Usitatibacter rugosus TaxID=2732067 RepID=A0A6M4GTQ8_9PROT|nr:hypothetical protein DSM104443_01758 [Usitatibacter rugosus]
MPDHMFECEVKKQFLVGERRVWRWTSVPVTKVFDAAPQHVRCLYCHGAVRVHKQKVAHGPQDHVEHTSRTDSEGCPAGHYFLGKPRLSSEPVK